MALLDDPIYKEYQRQRFFGTLGRIGQGLLSSRGRGVSPLERLAFGLTQGAGPGMNPMQMMQMRRQQEEDRREEEQRTKYQQLLGGQPTTRQQALVAGGGPTPQAQAMIGQPSPGLLGDIGPEQMGLLRSLDPETGMGLLAKRAFEKPEAGFTLSPGQERFGPGGGSIASVPAAPKERKTAKGAGGFLRYLDTGERAFPKAEKPKAGGMTYDPSLQMYYQTNPKGMREYVRPTTGLEVTTPEGTTVRTGVPTGRPSANRVDEIGAARDGIDLALSKLDNVQKAITSEPGRAGVTGSLATVTQNVTGMLGDIVSVAREQFGLDVELGRAEPALQGSFDPVLSEMDVLENSLAYSLARARKPTGRLNANDVDNARNDVRLKGLRSRADVEARVSAIQREFAQARSALDKRLEGGRSGSNPYSAMSDEQIMEQLRQGGYEVGPGTP